MPIGHTRICGTVFIVLVTQLVKECPVCQIAKFIGAAPLGPLRPILPSQPLLTTDLMGPLPVTGRGNKYILVVCDHFSKWSQAFALRSMQADEEVHHIVGFLLDFGLVFNILLDQGKNYQADLTRRVL